MIEFRLNDMTCGHCVASVTRALHEADADAKVEIDLPTKRVKIESAQPRETLVKVLTEAGYPPA